MDRTDRTYFEIPTWYDALTLTERLATFRTIEGTKQNVEIQADLAEQRLGRWRSQPPFTEDVYFAQRLAMDDMSEDDLLSLLGEPIEAVRDRCPVHPAWLTTLAQADCPPSPERFSAPEVLRDRDQETAGLLVAIEPLIRSGRCRLRQGIQALSQAHSHLPLDPNTVQDALYAHLSGRLLMMVSKTMVLELHVARLQGLLMGDDPAERFRSFIQRLQQRDTALALLREYPVLARQIITCIDHWVAFNLEFLQHLCADWEDIVTAFSPQSDPGMLVYIDGGMGDSHRDGRSVRILRFSSGFTVVYKPRSMALDVHFQELLAWLNERGDHHPFRTVTIVDRGTHGWMEFVAAQNCASVDEVRRFYERQGGYLALLHALEATDFHFENLIAAGEHPVLLDLEALFHQHARYDPKHADELAESRISHSVVSTGLLPYRIWANAESEGIDLSGLSAAAGQFTPHPVPILANAWTDEMRLVRQRIQLPGGQNRPAINGAEVNVLDYAHEIVAGFTTMYRLLLRHRVDLLSEEGPLLRFADDDVRVIVRPTQTYARILDESFHPDALRHGLDRDRLFDRLWAAVKHQPYLHQTIAAERDDLHKGDIPLFTSRPTSRDMWSSSKQRIPDFFDEPGMTIVRRRVQQLSEHDLVQQRWFIHASLATLPLETDHARWPTYRPTGAQTGSNRERLLAAARAVGDRLEELAVRGEDDVSWIGLTPTNEGHYSLTGLRSDLYAGLPGVLLFLAYLGTVTREDRYTALAQAALTGMRRQVELSRGFITSIGGFNGWGGVIYTLAHVGTLWDQRSLFSEAEALVELLPPLIERDDYFDVIYGAAGCLCGLLGLYRCAPSHPTLAAAVQCGDRLIAGAQTMEHGIGWLPPAGATKPLAGFSHGAAGVARALLELAALTGLERFRTAALRAITYERSLFNPDAGNWPDLRTFEHQTATDSQESFLTVWCHGAPGIGLARVHALPYLDDGEIRTEIETAMTTTLAQGFGHNHSLCHGDLGNLELLLQASETLDDPRQRSHVQRLAAMILESIERDGWLCGNPLGVESPGLMTGLAGIGYGLLRLAEPTRIPSVLVLAPPPQV